MGTPGASPRGRDDAPGHRDGTAADYHADRENGEALPQGRGVHGESELVAGRVGPSHDLAEERGKTEAHLQAATLAAPFGAALVYGIPIPVPEWFADRQLGAAQDRSEGDGNGR